MASSPSINGEDPHGNGPSKIHERLRRPPCLVIAAEGASSVLGKQGTSAGLGNETNPSGRPRSRRLTRGEANPYTNRQSLFPHGFSNESWDSMLLHGNASVVRVKHVL